MASITPISIREAIDNINATNNGWFLPYVQRQYVWGSRYESEKYICRLFDSILKGYPIGILIIWNTNKTVPYRKFIEKYINGEPVDTIVEKELWSRDDKWLVYDGQQRLQTLYSCLKGDFNGRKLAFDMLGAIKEKSSTEMLKSNPEDDFDQDEESNVWFSFFDVKDTLPKGYILMKELFTKTNKDEFKKFVATNIELEQDKENEEYESVFDDLWNTFISKEKKALAYFPIEKEWNEKKVNDVFQRLNTGGVSLSGADLLLSKIKEIDYCFEETLQSEVKELQKINGYSFNGDAILQMTHFIITRKLKIVPDKIEKKQLKEFESTAKNLYPALRAFCQEFMLNAFQINSNKIVSKLYALYPLVMYCYNKHLKGIKYKDFGTQNIEAMKQYFIFSQINDWNTSTITTKSCKIVLDSPENFPLDEIREIAKDNKRLTELSAKSLEGYQWFTLKICSPRKAYCWTNNISSRRYGPELDHIFPQKLVCPPADYYPDVVWNMQPISGNINSDKLNIHPKIYFEKHLDALEQYEFVPKELSDILWDNPNEFILNRKEKMLKWFEDNYKITIKDE